jgi:hypothetical protein
MIVDFPQPDVPTKANVLFFSTIMLISFKTFISFFVG